jgi:hypothetical protein
MLHVYLGITFLQVSTTEPFGLAVTSEDDAARSALVVSLFEAHNCDVRPGQTPINPL